MVNEITFDKLPQAVGYLTEQVERIYNYIINIIRPSALTNISGKRQITA